MCAPIHFTLAYYFLVLWGKYVCIFRKETDGLWYIAKVYFTKHVKVNVRKIVYF